MPDIFQAYDRDSDEPSTHYEVMEKRGTFWYSSGSYATRDEATAAAERVSGEGSAVVVDRMTRVPVLRLQGGPAREMG